jgi:ABC-type dipeptide/oligopeptide/nickel transport system ATPase component
LDVTVQAEILALLRTLRDQCGMGILFISHDLAVIGEMVDRVAVMYGGKIVEQGPVRQVVESPKHPYTAGLLSVR